MTSPHNKRRLILSCSFLLLLSTVAIRADLKVEELTQMKGGMMEGVMKMARVFGGGKGMGNSATTVYVKGERMRTDNLVENELESSEIIELDKEQTVSINHKKKTYSILTFAEKRAQMEKAMKEMEARRAEKPPTSPTAPPSDPNVKTQPKISIKDTGETKVINGFNTRHVIFSMGLEAEDLKTKEKSSMGTTMDLWLSKDIPGLEERKQFMMRYAQKMGSSPYMKNMGMTMAQDPQMMKAIEEMSKESRKMEGDAVLTIMNFPISAAPGADSSAQTSQPRHQPEAEQESTSPTNASEALGQIFGGGFGHKKKPKPAQEPGQSNPSQPNSSGPASVNLMSMTVEIKSVSQSPLSGTLFEVPAGFRLVTK